MTIYCEDDVELGAVRHALEQQVALYMMDSEKKDMPKQTVKKCIAMAEYYAYLAENVSKLRSGRA